MKYVFLVNGGWTTWSLGECLPNSNGKLEQTNRRECSNPLPRNGGRGCHGNTERMLSCLEPGLQCSETLKAINQSSSSSVFCFNALQNQSLVCGATGTNGAIVCPESNPSIGTATAPCPKMEDPNAMERVFTLRHVQVDQNNTVLSDNSNILCCYFFLFYSQFLEIGALGSVGFVTTLVWSLKHEAVFTSAPGMRRPLCVLGMTPC